MARRQVDSRLAAVADRFCKWRKERSRGQRIPERLWRAAVQLAPECGLCRTAQALRLDYYTLKRRCEEAELAAPSQSQTQPQWVELPSSVAPQECLIELEDLAGAKMRIHLKGQTPDLVALASMFRGGK